MTQTKQTGFTIVELLIVIIVIGILAGLVLTTFFGAQAKARDGVRKSDFRQLETALQLYYETYGAYPCGDANASGGGTHDGSGSDSFLNGAPVSNCDTSIAPAEGLYDTKIFPDIWRHDPINKEGSHLYWYVASSDRQSYVLYTRLESDPETMKNDKGQCDNFYEKRSGPETVPMTGTHQNYAFGVACQASS